MDWAGQIVKTPGVVGGRPRIEGTRIAVDLILEFTASGFSEADILEFYPHLTPQNIRDCLSYADAHGMVAYADWDTEFCPYHHGMTAADVAAQAGETGTKS